MNDHDMAACDFDTLGWRVKPRADALRFNRTDCFVVTVTVALTSLNVAGLLWNAYSALRGWRLAAMSVVA